MPGAGHYPFLCQDDTRPDREFPHVRRYRLLCPCNHSPLVPHGEDVAIPSLVSPGVYSPITFCSFSFRLASMRHVWWPSLIHTGSHDLRLHMTLHDSNIPPSSPQSCVATPSSKNIFGVCTVHLFLTIFSHYDYVQADSYSIRPIHLYPATPIPRWTSPRRPHSAPGSALGRWMLVNVVVWFGHQLREEA